MAGRDFKIGITWQIGNTAAVTSAVNGVTGSLTKLQGSTTTAAGGVNTFGSSMQGTLPSLTGYNNAAQKSVGANSAMSSSFGKSSGALGGLSSQIGTTSRTLPQLTSAQQMAAQSSSDLASKSTAMTAKMTQIGSKVGGLAFLFGGLTAAMGESQGMQEQLASQQEKLNDAQENAAKVIKQYGASSNEATEALKEVEKAERSVAFAGRIARLSYQDQIFYILSLSSLAIGPAVTAFGKFREAQTAAAAAGVPLIQSLRNSGGAVGKLFGLFDRLTGSAGKTTAAVNTMPPVLRNVGITTVAARTATGSYTGALGNFGGAATKATGITGKLGGAFGGLRGAMAGGMAILGPIGLALLGVGAAMAIISTNTFGSRTALDNFGKSAGDQIPILGVLFEGIRDVGEAMGIAEDNGRSASDAWAAMEEQHRKNAESATTHSEAWGTLFQNIVDHPITQAIIAGFETLGSQMQTIFDTVVSTIDSALLQVGGFVVNNIVNPILAIPGQIVSVGQSILLTITNAWTGFLDAVNTNIVQPILNIPGQLGQIGIDIANMIINGWNNIVSFVETHIINPIIGIPGNLGTIGIDIANAIISGWNNIVTFVQTHIVNPLLNIPTLITTLGPQIVETIAAGWNTFVGLIQTNLVDPLLDVPGHISNLGQMIVDIIQEGWDTFANVIQQNLIGPLLDIPTHLGNIGKLIIDTLTNGWNAFVGLVQQHIVQPLLDLPSHLGNLGRLIVEGLGDVAGDMQNWINNNLIQPFVDFNKKIEENFASGKSIIDSITGALFGVGQEAKAMGEKTAEGTKKASDAAVDLDQKLQDMLKTATKSRETLGTAWDLYLQKVPLANRATIDAGEFLRNVAINDIPLTDEQLKILSQTWVAYTTNAGDADAQTAAVSAALSGTTTKAKATGGAVAEVSNAMTSLADTLATNARNLTAYGVAMATGTFQTQTFKQGQQEAELGLVAVALELQNTAGQVDFYSQENALAIRLLLEFAAGVERAKLALIEKKAELAGAAGELSHMASVLADGTIQENAYAEGVIESGNALIGRVEALEQSKAAFELNNQLINEAGLLALAFAEGEQEMKTEIQETTQELANQAGALAALSDEATFLDAANNALIQGFLEQEQALADLALSYFEAIGKTESLKQSMASVEEQQALLAVGFAQGQAEANEWANGIAMATGESIGFHEALVSIANGLNDKVKPSLSASSEQLQRFIGAMAGLPDALGDVVNGIDGMASEIVDLLRKAGEDGKNAFDENMDKLEEEMGIRFSEPVQQKIEFEADLADAQDKVQVALQAIAASLKPIQVGDKIQFDTRAIEASIKDAIRIIDSLPTEIQPSLAQTRAALEELSKIDFDTATFEEIVGAMAKLLTESENLGSSLPGMLNALSSMPEFAKSGAAGLDKLNEALKGTGFHVDEAGRIIETATGNIITDLNSVVPPAENTAAKIGELGPAADAARDAWARDMQIMFFAVDKFGVHAQTMAVTVSGAYSNMSTNIHLSLSTLAGDFQIMFAAVQKFATDNQTMALTVSTAYSNMAINTGLSLVTMGEQMILFNQIMTQQLFLITQGLNLFAVEFMPLWAEDINVNGLLPTTLHFETFVLTAGEHILTLSTALNIFAAEFMPTFAADVGTHLTTAAGHFSTFGTVAGENLLSSAEILNTFASEFMSAFSNDIQTHLTTAAGHFTTFGQQAGENVFRAADILNEFASSFMSAFAADIRTHVTAAAGHFRILQTAAQTTASAVTSALNSMRSSASSFASSFGSSMSSVVSSANRARSAVDSLRSAIASLRSKTITITTIFVTRRITLRHGGAFINMQHGGAFINTQERDLGPARISEFNKPELVTVTPLSNPNDITDKTIRINTGSLKRAVSADTNGKGKGSIKKEVLEPIFVTIDGEVIMKLVQKRLLEFAGDNII